MHATRHTPGYRQSPGRIAIVGLMLALWIGVVGLSSSEKLHHLLHEDSQHANHDCLLTSFAKGQLLTSPTAIPVPLPVFICLGFLAFAGLFSLPILDVRLVPGRAPPFGLLHP